MRKLIFHIPHASTFIPEDVRADILLDDAALADELRLLTDHFTDDLFAAVIQLGDSVVACPVSRLVVDVERFTDDADEPMSAQGMGTVYTKAHDGKVLRGNSQSRDELLQRFYVPHHAALHQAVEKHLTDQGEAIIIDCHSFPERALPYEKNQSLHRPEICIGTDPFHTPEDLAVSVGKAYLNAGFKVARNTPFAGAIVPLAHYGRNTRVRSFMIEIRRDIYMDEKTLERKSEALRLSRANANAVHAARSFGI